MRTLLGALALATALVSIACSDDTATSPTPTGAGSTATGTAAGGTGGLGTGGAAGAGASQGGGGQGGGDVALGIEDDGFTLDGVPTFLLGVSYFDGKNWHADDLDALAARRFNLIRIWLDWADQSYFDGTGQLVAEQELLELVRACRARGIAVDVTVLDTDLTLSDPDAAVAAAVEALAGEPNVLFDRVNEHDHSGDTFSHDDVAALALVARTADPQAIVTVSSQGGHIVADMTLVPDNIDAEIVDAGLDLLTPHLTRTEDFYAKTGARVTLIKEYLSSIGHVVPVYLQEEARRGHSGLDPTMAQFLQAAREARDAGAAGWIFHTDAGFDLAAASFMDSLDTVEAATVDALGAEIYGPP